MFAKSVFTIILLNFAYRIKNLCSDKFKKFNYKYVTHSALKYGYPTILIKSILKY